jgi:hypothetical protein
VVACVPDKIVDCLDVPIKVAPPVRSELTIGTFNILIAVQLRLVFFKVESIPAVTGVRPLEPVVLLLTDLLGLFHGVLRFHVFMGVPNIIRIITELILDISKGLRHKCLHSL